LDYGVGLLQPKSVGGAAGALKTLNIIIQCSVWLRCYSDRAKARSIIVQYGCFGQLSPSNNKVWLGNHRISHEYMSSITCPLLGSIPHNPVIRVGCGTVTTLRSNGYSFY
jgi:hypothetical protein